ncbi:4-trimethylaminobutyraldehyde dehydrogenase-like [Pollicipes pollicipes]|uniref:4-trimethylaminobutyraldehyde dehydrogenase-like n=1 Tax=Pollicipes pollicipes TaxID=41117 RepID=UPI0018857967|nr:4-trimethylaminobutyraldehyde dehydrogenase-like [Pollicipes pollicipes]XP_037090174.1 4-trimethylaminobutyraldehyde dehydrogenase-like [Pollicipes pollicipes]XP_037090175.1 4-trimethylaminobutyraldehyde dehydrogenase-like [Pollicipes pollicipes]
MIVGAATKTLRCLTTTVKMQKFVCTSIQEPLNFISNKRCAPADKFNEVDNLEPATGKVLLQFASSAQNEVNRAVKAAKEALPAWSALTAAERGVFLKKAATIIEENLEDIAQMEVKDCGKPIWEARIDVQSVADTLNYFAGVTPEAMKGTYQPQPGGSYALVQREPVGVCVGVGAWNYPIQTCVWKTAPALACGNTFVYKPSPLTPVTAVTLGEALAAAGVPPGVYGVVQGEGETGHLLCSHPDVAKVSFTGSVGTGSKIMADAARDIKKVTMELGGKSPLIIFEDADLKNAVRGAMLANFLSQGQVCNNGTRVFVHASIKERFTAALVEAAEKLKVGDPLKEDTTVGATVCRQQFDKVMGFIERAKKEGGRVLCGGERVTLPGELAGGCYLRPCVVACPRDDMELVREEVFGAVLALLEFTDEEDVVRRANDTRYGLSAGIFTRDLSRAHRVMARLQAGACFVNTYNVMPVGVPFGGYKMSGFGRENAVEAVQSYTQLKSVYVETGDVDAAPLCT